MLDWLAKRYSKLPSELLDLDLFDWNFNLEVAAIAMQAEQDAAFSAKQGGAVEAIPDGRETAFQAAQRRKKAVKKV